MLNLSFHLLNFLIGVDERAEGNCKLVGANHEGRCSRSFLVNNCNRRKVAHLLNHAVVLLVSVSFDDLKLKLASKVDVEKPVRIRLLRREVARMLTVLAAAKKEVQ